MKVVFTSDTHVGHIYPEALVPMRDKILAEKPDLFAVLGDVGDGLRNFQACLTVLREIGVKSKHGAFVIPGNHDIYNYDRLGSERLYRDELRAVSAPNGFHYGNNMRVVKADGHTTAFLFCPCWCNATFNSSGFTKRLIDDAYYTDLADGKMITMDIEVLHKEQLKWVREKLSEIEANGEIDQVVIGSHYPIFAELYMPYGTPRPSDAYFYSPEFGDLLLEKTGRRSRVISVSGHVHRHERKQVGHVECYIIGAQYRKPEYIALEI